MESLLSVEADAADAEVAFSVVEVITETLAFEELGVLGADWHTGLGIQVEGLAFGADAGSINELKRRIASRDAS